MRKKILTAAFLFGLNCNGFCQSNPVWFVTQIKNDREIPTIYDSVELPLLILNNNVYSISSECITHALAADANDRNLGGGANKRNNAATANNRRDSGEVNDRSNAGNANDRTIDGGAADRPNGGGHNHRNNGGNANNRQNEGNTNDRSNDGALLSFYCTIDKKGKLILYFKNITNKDHVRIYYGHSFFNSKYFKIQPL